MVLAHQEDEGREVTEKIRRAEDAKQKTQGMPERYMGEWDEGQR